MRNREQVCDPLDTAPLLTRAPPRLSIARTYCADYPTQSCHPSDRRRPISAPVARRSKRTRTVHTMLDFARLRRSFDIRRAPNGNARVRRGRMATATPNAVKKLPAPPARRRKPRATTPAPARGSARDRAVAPLGRGAPAPARASPLTVSSFNSADYSELFGSQSSDWYGHRATPRPGRRVQRQSVVASQIPNMVEPQVVVIDGAQVGGRGRLFDAEALRAAVHHYTALGMRTLAVIPPRAVSTGTIALADAAKLRMDALRGRVVFTPPTSRHDLYVRDMARRHSAFVVTNNALPPDLSVRAVPFRPATGSFRPTVGPGTRR